MVPSNVPLVFKVWAVDMATPTRASHNTKKARLSEQRPRNDRVPPRKKSKARAVLFKWLFIPPPLSDSRLKVDAELRLLVPLDCSLQSVSAGMRRIAAIRPQCASACQCGLRAGISLVSARLPTLQHDSTHFHYRRFHIVLAG